jgi:WD40 repeat protein
LLSIPHSQIASSLPLHSTAITALKVYDTGIISGSFDQLVICSLDNATGVSPLLSMSIFEMVTSSAGFSAPLHLSKSYKQKNKITSIDSDPLGQRIAISCSSSPIMILTTDSRTVQLIAEGHGSASRVAGIAAFPGSDAVLTLTEDDCSLRLWDVSQRTIDNTPEEASALLTCKHLSHQPTAAVFLNASVLLVAIKNADTDGKSASILMVSVTRSLETTPKYKMSVFARVHNVGTGAIRSLTVSPHWKHLAACSEDGCVYMYRLNDVSSEDGELKNVPFEASSESKESSSSSTSIGDAKAETWLAYTGILLAHPSGTPVAGLDFSDSGRYIRSFGDNHAGSNGRVEVNYFDMEQHSSAATHAAAKVQDPEALQQVRSVQWSTVSSAAAPEVSAVSFAEGARVLQVEHIAASNDRSLVCASFTDGSVKLYR